MGTVHTTSEKDVEEVLRAQRSGSASSGTRELRVGSDQMITKTKMRETRVRA